MCEGGQARLRQARGGIRGRGDNSRQDAKRKNNVLLTGKADGQASEGHLNFVRPLTGSVEGPVTTAGKLCPLLVPPHSRPQGPAQELGFKRWFTVGKDYFGLRPPPFRLASIGSFIHRPNIYCVRLNDAHQLRG